MITDIGVVCIYAIDTTVEIGDIELLTIFAEAW